MAESKKTLLDELLGSGKQYSNERLSDFRLPEMLPFPPPQTATINDRWFKDQTISIDGYTFLRCRFDRCNLITEFATFNFENSFISPECKLYLKGASLKVARLLMHQLRMMGRIQGLDGEEGIFAPLNPDGTFSLK